MEYEAASLIIQFFYEKAFDKKRGLIKRLPYVIFYVVFLIITIFCVAYISLNLIKDKQIENKIIGYLLILLVPLLLIMLLYPLYKEH